MNSFVFFCHVNIHRKDGGWRSTRVTKQLITTFTFTHNVCIICIMYILYKYIQVQVTADRTSAGAIRGCHPRVPSPLKLYYLSATIIGIILTINIMQCGCENKTIIEAIYNFRT